MNRLFNIFSATTLIVWAVLIALSVSGVEPKIVSGLAMMFAGAWMVIIGIAVFIKLIKKNLMP
jgi:hypothetical protein